MTNKLYKSIPIFVIFISFVLAVFFYFQMPPFMATHWGIVGQVNGYSSKLFALFFPPTLSLILYFLFLFLPKAEPYQKNFNQFRHYYEVFMVIIFLFLFYLYLLTLFWNLGFNFNMVQFLSPAFFVIFYYAGVLASKTKKNWFVGIRTPWAYKNDKVWSKTQQFGGKLFKFSALLCLVGIFLPQYALFFVLFPVLISTIIVTIYSYFESQKK